VIPFAMKHPNNFPTKWSDWFVDEIEFGEKYSLWEKAQRALKITYSLEARDKMARLLAQNRPTIAHAHNVYHHISPSFFGTLKAHDVPTVLTLHDLKIACPAYKMLTHDGICERCKGGAIWNVIRHRCIKGSLNLSAVIFMESAIQRMLGCYSRGVDRFVTPSQFYLEKFVEWGWPRERFTYVPNFVDVGHLKPRGEPGNAFAYFGRLGPEKGLTTFVEAVALAGVRAWIIGTGPEESKLREQASACGAQVEFMGYRSGQELFDTIRGARAIVLPSEWFENAPMSVLEAYAVERPVIGADIGGIPELIRSGETGDVFPSGDAPALAEILRNYASAPASQLREMGAAGRAWVLNDFTAERYRDRLLGVYRELGGIR